MILILTPNVDTKGAEYKRLMSALGMLPNIQSRVHNVHGAQQTLTEVYLIGDTKLLSLDRIARARLHRDVEAILRAARKPDPAAEAAAAARRWKR